MIRVLAILLIVTAASGCAWMDTLNTATRRRDIEEATPNWETNQKTNIYEH